MCVCVCVCSPARLYSSHLLVCCARTLILCQSVNCCCCAEYLSQGTTLEPGTLILTGTPSVRARALAPSCGGQIEYDTHAVRAHAQGVGFARTPPVFLAPGDIVEVSIEGLGTLSNTVGLESPQHS